MEYFVHIGSRRLRVELADGELRVDGRPLALELAPSNGNPVRSVRAEGRSIRVIPRRNGRGDWTLDIDGVRVRAEVLDRGQEAIRAARGAAAATRGPAPLRAPMPGMVVRVEVGEGDLVEAGDGLVIVEAMKMENELRAAAPARVRTVRARPGAAVEKDEVLIEFEPPVETEEEA